MEKYSFLRKQKPPISQLEVLVRVGCTTLATPFSCSVFRETGRMKELRTQDKGYSRVLRLRRLVRKL